MMKWSAKMTVLLAMLSSLAQAQEVLRVYNWIDYIDPQVVADFERTTGIKVDYQQFTASRELLEGLERGERFDVIIPTSDSVLIQLLQDRHLQPVDVNKLKNYPSVSIDLLMRLSAFQQSNRYVVPYMWGTVGMFVNTAQVEPFYNGEIPNSWSLLFDSSHVERLSGCGVSLLNAQEQVFSIWFSQRGRSLGDSSARQISAAAPMIRNPRVAVSPPEFSAYIEQMQTGKVCVGMSWDGLVTAANDKGQLRYSIPEEGGLLFIDSLAIPANAPNPELAHRFIDFMLAPENAVRNALTIGFTPSLDLGREEYSAMLPNITLPSQDERRRLHFLERISPAQQAAVQEGWDEYVINQ